MTNGKVRVVRYRLMSVGALALLFTIVLIGCASASAAPSNVLKVGYNEASFVQIAKVAEPVAVKGGKLPVRKRYAIEGLEIPSDFYAPLANKDLSVNLNIISGRKSSPNNLISCDILEGRLSDLVGRRFFLTGKLIRE